MLVLTLGGCAHDAELDVGCGRLAYGEVHVLSWWSAGRDEQALALAKEAGETCNPDLSVDTSHAAASKNDAEGNFASSLSHPAPDAADLSAAGSSALAPDALEPNAVESAAAAADVTFDVFITNLDTVRDFGCKQGKLLPLSLDDLAGREELPDDTPGVLRDVLVRIACQGQKEVPAVPLMMHRLNRLYYNRQKLEALGLTEESVRTWEGFTATLEQAAEGGMATPLVVNQDDDSWSQLVLENMLLAIAGQDEYEAFWRGRLAKEAAPTTFPALEAALAALRSIAARTTQAPSALDAVARGDALFTTAGDWVAPTDGVGETDFPGTGAYYLYTLDVAVIPTNAPNVDGARALLRSLTYAPNNIKIAEAKGAQPLTSVYFGAETATTLVPSVPVLVDSAYFEDLNEHVERIWRDSADPAKADGIAQELLDTITADYCKLDEARCFGAPPAEPQ